MNNKTGKPKARIIVREERFIVREERYANPIAETPTVKSALELIREKIAEAHAEERDIEIVLR